jgi:hypothetical protein
MAIIFSHVDDTIHTNLQPISSSPDLLISAAGGRRKLVAAATQPRLLPGKRKSQTRRRRREFVANPAVSWVACALDLLLSIIM